ncbi:MAG: FAD-dependent oxidoreductase [Proteobacteria bacterium]|nr:FAD-dependent oxidoreductase [Pseudomonadota bacterium]
MYDYIVVGGGSAGCAITGRLSARPTNRVLLIEAGPDTPPGQVPDDILDGYPGRAYNNPGYIWPDLRVAFQPASRNAPEPSPERRYEQARVMGGGSSINGQIAVRGAPADYDEWERMGAKGWGWGDVLPYFRKLERDLDFDGPEHGRDGPIPIRRIFPDRWEGFSRAVAEAWRSAGYSYHADMNGSFVEGYFPVPCSNADNQRVSSAIAYLDAATRGRPNLRVLPGTVVRRLLMDGNRVTGVEVERDGMPESIAGRQVIVCAGAIHSPALLLRAGIGPAAELKGHGIEVAADLPGVGRNLHDHPATAICVTLPPAARFDPAVGRHVVVNLRYSSGVEGCPPVDMVLNTASRSAWHPLGKQLGSFQIWIAKPFSRGYVRLAPGNSRQEPEVVFAMLSDPRDCERLKHGMRMVAAMLAEEPLSSTARDPFPTSYSERVRNVNRLTLVNLLLTGIGACLMQGPGPVRRAFIRAAITEGLTLSALLDDDAALEAFLRKTVTGIWHVCGTCRMGADDDAMAVTDASARVRGVHGLRVVDASLMPFVPAANTNIPTIMCAEKIADAILAE